MKYNQGDKVRINTPSEADHGAIVEVIGMHTSKFEPNGDQHLWVMMPFNFAWLYKVTEVEPVDTETTTRTEALRILQACDPGDCGCGQPHELPENSDELIAQMVELLVKNNNNKEGE